MSQQSIRLLLALSFVSAAALFAGCSSSSQLGTLNDFCGSKHPNPAQLSPGIVVKNGRTQIRAGQKFTPNVADYAFVSAEIFYNDNFNDIHQDYIITKNSAGDMVASLNCSSGRGIAPTMQTLDASIPFVSDIKFDGSNVYIRHRDLSFTIGQPAPGQADQDFTRNKKVTPRDPSTYAIGDLSTTYSDYSVVDQSFNQVSVDNANYSYVLAADVKAPAPREKKGDDLEVRVLVYLQPVTAAQRHKIDHPPAPVRPGR